MDSENLTEVTDTSSYEGMSATEKEAAAAAAIAREAVESEFLQKLLIQRQIEYDMRNLKLLNKIKEYFDSVESFKASRAAAKQELEELESFMTELGEEDPVISKIVK